MFDQAAPPLLQRSAGAAMARFDLRAGRTILADLRQEGCAKVMLPRSFGPVPEAVFMNTAGGLTGGDSLSYAITLGAGTTVCATTQTAERAYASTGSAAQVQISADLGAKARLDWLPQETILFEAAHLRRKTHVNLADGASVLLVESLALGRRAMGEVLRRAHITDQRTITRNGRPFWAETLRLDAGSLARSNEPALLGGARAMAVIAFIASGAEDAAPTLRALGQISGAQMAVSGWDGRCLIRITATDSWPLRAQMIRVISTLRAAPMPRVWQC
ncbi:MAG: urease accessory protein UreD [Cypionkella sp.]